MPNIVKVLILIAVMLCIYVIARNRYEKKKAEKGEEIKRLHPVTRFFINLFVVFVCIMLICVGMIVEKYYIFFGKKRIAEMEQSFGISIKEEMKPKKFIRLNGPDGDAYILEIEDIDDYSEFRVNNCNGEIKLYTEKGYVYSSDNEFKPEILTKSNSGGYRDECDEYFQYEYQGREYFAYFYEDDDKYKVRITG